MGAVADVGAVGAIFWVVGAVMVVLEEFWATVGDAVGANDPVMQRRIGG